VTLRVGVPGPGLRPGSALGIDAGAGRPVILAEARLTILVAAAGPWHPGCLDIGRT